jgi:drug/metabolite transporter (DMT)-like permease
MSLRESWRALPGNLRGAALIVFAGVFVTVEAMILRFLSPETGSVLTALARAITQFGFGLLMVIPLGPWLRGGLTSLTAWWLYYASVRELGLALATVMTFTSTLFVVPLARPILGERVGAARWIATAAGFAGVLLIIRPGVLPIGWGIVMALGSAMIGAASTFLNRALTASERTETIMLWVGIVTLAGAVPAALVDARAPGWHDALLLALAATIGTGCMWLFIEAYRHGEVSALQPFGYLKLVSAAIVGWLVFAEWPDVWTWTGSAVIIASALALARIEVRRARQ